MLWIINFERYSKLHDWTRHGATKGETNRNNGGSTLALAFLFCFGFVFVFAASASVATLKLKRFVRKFCIEFREYVNLHWLSRQLLPLSFRTFHDQADSRQGIQQHCAMIHVHRRPLEWEPMCVVYLQYVSG